MAAVNSNIGSSLIKFTFTDSDGDVVASFRMNPADVKLAARCEEMYDFFDTLAGNVGKNATLSDAVKFNDEIEEKMCYLLGYDVKQSLFGLISATSIMGDGKLFIAHVVDTITRAVSAEIKKRKQAMAKSISKYTAKYEK